MVMTNAATAVSAMVITIGSDVPLKNSPATAITAPPVSICNVPPSALALPAMGP